MDEMYRMLGRERQSDLEREANRRRLAAAARTKPRVPPPIDGTTFTLASSRLAAFLRREAPLGRTETEGRVADSSARGT